MLVLSMLGGSVGSVCPIALKAMLKGVGGPTITPPPTDGDQTPYDPKFYTPPPKKLSYNQSVRLDGNLGLGEGVPVTIPVIDECTGDTVMMPGTEYPDRQEILATIGNGAVICDGVEVVPGVECKEGNADIIPAGWYGISLSALADNLPGAKILINGFEIDVCCRADFQDYIKGMLDTKDGIPYGSEIKIEACEAACIQIDVCRVVEVPQPAIQIPAIIKSKVPECRIDKNNDDALVTIFYTTDNCGVSSYVDKDNNPIALSDIDTRYCWPTTGITLDNNTAGLSGPEGNVNINVQVPLDPKSVYLEPHRECCIDQYDDNGVTKYEVFFKEYLYNCDTPGWELRSKTDCNMNTYDVRGTEIKVPHDSTLIRRDGMWTIPPNLTWSPPAGLGLGYTVHVRGASNGTTYTDSFGRSETLEDNKSYSFPGQGLSDGKPVVKPGPGAIVTITYQSQNQ